MFERLKQILTEWLERDTADRKFNERFADPNNPTVRSENERLDSDIERSKRLLDEIGKKDA